MNSSDPKGPRSEPEIIPPGKEPRSGVKWIWYNQQDTSYLRNQTRTVFTIILVLAFAALLAILALILISKFLIWIPLATLLIAIALVSGWRQAFFRR